MTEKKTIGAFLAALRKANGMTQADLAEKLNVSDKTISRWERDDSAPDLSVLPVLAEIFGVTCDELLRGQRRPEELRSEPAEPSGKSEKQRQRLLASGLNRYKNRSLIAVGIMLAGLLAAMAVNLGLLRARMGFFVGAAFYLAGAICQGIFVNQALFSVTDAEGDTGEFRCQVHRLARWVFGLDGLLLGVTLPLLLVSDALWGLDAKSWLGSGLLLGAAALVLVVVLCWFVQGHQVRRQVYPARPNFAHNHRLQKQCALVLAGALAVTALCQWGYNQFLADRSGEKRYFDDMDSFIAYLEQDLPYGSYTMYGTAVEQAISPMPDDSADPNVWQTYITDGERVVREFHWRNRQVARINTELSGGQRLYVITYEAQYAAGARIRAVNTLFVGLYAVEAAAALAFYWKKRQK